MDVYKLVCKGGLITVSMLLRDPWKGQAVIFNPYKLPMKDKSTVPAFSPEILYVISARSHSPLKLGDKQGLLSILY